MIDYSNSVLTYATARLRATKCYLKVCFSGKEEGNDGLKKRDGKPIPVQFLHLC